MVSRSGMRSASMSVRLVVVWTNGPDRLHRDLLIDWVVRDPLPLVLRAQKDPFALPQRERRDELSGDDSELGRFDIIVAGAQNEAPVQPVGRADVRAEARGSY